MLIPSHDGDRQPSRPAVYRRSFLVSGTSYPLILLPVWVQTLREGDKEGIALVNGDTGKVALGKWERLRGGG